MFCDVTTHLDVSETLDTQVCDYVDIGQIDAGHAVVVFKLVGEGLDLHSLSLVASSPSLGSSQICLRWKRNVRSDGRALDGAFFRPKGTGSFLEGSDLR